MALRDSEKRNKGSLLVSLFYGHKTRAGEGKGKVENTPCNKTAEKTVLEKGLASTGTHLSIPSDSATMSSSPSVSGIVCPVEASTQIVYRNVHPTLFHLPTRR